MKKYYSEEVVSLKEVPKGEFFRIVDSKGKIGKKVYRKEEFDRSDKKYQCMDCLDALGNGRKLKPKQKVLVGFEY